MATPTQLVTGLAGAIGSDFRSSHNQLVFVEYGGKLSRLNLFPSATIIASATSILKGTFTFDFDTGVEGGAGPATMSGGISKPPLRARWCLRAPPASSTSAQSISIR